MSNIKTKILSGDLLSLTHEDYNIITNNTELITLFLTKVKEGCLFDFDNLTQEIGVTLLSKEYLPYFLENIKKTNPKYFIQLYADDLDAEIPKEEGIDQEGMREVIIQYYNEHSKEIIDLFTKVDYDYIIKNKDFIDYIIRHNLTKYASMISIENPSTEIEDFIIRNLDNNNGKIHTFSERIVEACINTGNASLLIEFYERSEDLANAILDDVGKGNISYQFLPESFKRKYKTDVRVAKACILDGRDYELDFDTIHNNPELITFLAKAIRDNGRLIYHVDNHYNVFPEVFAAKVTMVPSFSELGNLIFYTDEFGNHLKTHCALIVDAFKDYYEKHVQDGMNIFELLVVNVPSAYINQFDELLNTIISRLTFSEYLSIINGMHYKSKVYQEMFDKKIEDVDIVINVNLDDVNFKEDHPKRIKLQLIRLMNFDQLDPNLVSSHYYADSELCEAIMVRLAELRSNKWNSSFYEFSGKLTPRMIDIILREDNPLNLTPTQILNFIPNDTGKLKMEYLIPIIERTQVLTVNDVNAILRLLFAQKYNSDTGNYYLEFDEQKEKILSTLLTSNKIDNDDSLYKVLFDILNVELNELSDEQLSFDNRKKIFDLFKDFLMTKRHVPLYITDSEYFDAELRKTVSYDLNDLSMHPELFDGEPDNNYRKRNSNPIPEDFIKFVENALKKGAPVDIYVYSRIANLIKTNYLETGNFTFNHKLSTNVLYSNLKYDNPGSIRVAKTWFESITLNDLINIDMFNLFIQKEELLELIMERSKKEDVTFKGNVLNILKNTYSKEFFNRAKMFLFNLLSRGKVELSDQDFVPNYFNLPYPEVQEYFIEHYLKKATSFKFWKNDIFEAIARNKNYYNCIVSRCKRSPKLFIDHIDIIVKYKELKNVYIELIRTQRIDLESLIINSSSYFDKDVMGNILEINPDTLKKYITYLIHNCNSNTVQDVINEDNYPIIRNYLSQIYEFDINCFDTLFNLYQYDTLRLLENDNILNLLKKDIKIVERFVEIYKVRKLDLSTLEGINDSIQQHIYTIKNPGELNIYTNILEAIQQGISEEKIQEYINLLCKKDSDGKYIYLPDKIESKDEELNQLFINNKEEFLRELFKKIAINQNIYAPILSIITSSFLAQRRVDVMRGENIFTDTDVGFVYDVKQLRNAKFEYLLKNGYEILLKHLQKLSYTSKKALELDVLTLKFLIDRDNVADLSSEQIAMIKKNIRPLKNKFIDLLDNFDEYWIDDDSYLVGVRKTINIEDRIITSNDVGNVNFDTVMEILSDDDKYRCLLKIINKYKILDWGNIFDKPISSLSLGEYTPDLYNFINVFNTIYDVEMKNLKKKRKELIEEGVNSLRENGADEEKIEKFIKFKEDEPYEINLNAFKILKYCTIYSSISNAYKILLGLEDFELVRRNDQPNSAYKGTTEQRLDYDADLMIKMMQMDEITIPAFVKTYEPKEEGKRPLQAIVGCKADPRNLTQGERTGACMRAYGHAHDLFTFVNTDPRGFHITFVDPEDGEYISRVSGFRNGNTVFLNQLRYSCNHNKYSNKDVVEACRDIANELIERSKGCEMPIENVVCSPCYSLEGYSTQTLSEWDIGNGVYNGYKDVNQNAVVLATVGKKGVAVPVKLDSIQPVYETCRLPLREFKYPEITDNIKILIQRIDAIKVCIQECKNDPEYFKSIDFDFDILENEFTYAILGQDFYVALDINGNIIKNIAVENERSLAEYNDAINKVELFKQNMALGGISNGLL